MAEARAGLPPVAVDEAWTCAPSEESTSKARSKLPDNTSYTDCLQRRWHHSWQRC